MLPMQNEGSMVERAVEAIRREAERCDAVTDVLLTHSISGGTGELGPRQHGHGAVLHPCRRRRRRPREHPLIDRWILTKPQGPDLGRGFCKQCGRSRTSSPRTTSWPPPSFHSERETRHCRRANPQRELPASTLPYVTDC